MTAITIPRALLEQALDALEAAKNGLLWYQDTYPDATNDSDDEAMGKIDSALETLRAELAKPATAPDDQLRKDAERMKEGLDAVEVLIDNSSGVAGLHQNGDVASWRELRTGGRFEAWLLAFDEAIDAAMKGTP